MTNEEAIRILSGAIEQPNPKVRWIHGQALTMAIKALEIQAWKPNGDDWEGYADRLYDLAYQHGQEGKEPCEDCVSRKEVIKIYRDTVHTRKLTEMLVRFKKLSSVQPTRPTARWKKLVEDYNKCSKCGEMGKLYRIYKYCPHCGAKMNGVAKEEEE